MLRRWWRGVEVEVECEVGVVDASVCLVDDIGQGHRDLAWLGEKGSVPRDVAGD